VETHNKRMQRARDPDKCVLCVGRIGASLMRSVMRKRAQFPSPLPAVVVAAVVGSRVFAQDVAARSESTACPVTQPNDGWFANENLKAAAPGDAAVVFEPGGPGFVDYDGGLGMKWPWVRLKEGKLFIGGRRLDGDAAPARAYISDGYGLVGFQPVYLVLPTPGCWEITGAVAGSTLTFVMKVVRVDEGPTWKWNQGEMPAPGWRVSSDWREQ
jgi:hypothetical protein